MKKYSYLQRLTFIIFIPLHLTFAQNFNDCLKDLNQSKRLMVTDEDTNETLYYGQEIQKGMTYLYRLSIDGQVEDVVVTSTGQAWAIPYGPECLENKTCVDYDKVTVMKFKVNDNIFDHKMQLLSPTEPLQEMAQVKHDISDRKGRLPADNMPKLIELNDSHLVAPKQVFSALLNKVNGPDVLMADLDLLDKDNAPASCRPFF